jgi:hypothetical protein
MRRVEKAGKLNADAGYKMADHKPNENITKKYKGNILIQ